MADKKDEKSVPPAQRSSIDAYVIKDPETFARNLARMIEQAGHAASAWIAPRESGEKTDNLAEPMADVVKTFSKVSEYWLSTRSAPSRRRRGCFPPTWTSGRIRSADGRSLRRRSRRAGTRRPPLFRRGLEGQRLLFLPEADLSRHLEMGGRPRRKRRDAGRPHAPQGRFLRQAARQRRLAVEFHGLQSGGLQGDDRQQRREPRRRHEDAGRGHRGRQGRIEGAPGRLFEIQARREHRRDAGQGDRAQPAGRNHPVRAGDRRGAQAPAADLPALDQQVLHPRSQSG
jgi:hypothetical protein